MKPFAKYGLRTGIISGLWVIGAFTIVGWMNSSFFHNSIPAAHIRSYSGLFSLLILVLGIFFGMRELKRKNGGTLTYGAAIKTGIIISVITGIIVSIFSLLYCTVINPGFANFMVKDAEHTLTASGMAPEEIARKLEEVRKEFSTPLQVLMALAGQSVVGSIISLVMGLFIRTKN